MNSNMMPFSVLSETVFIKREISSYIRANTVGASVVAHPERTRKIQEYASDRADAPWHQNNFMLSVCSCF
jgi:hypothetical protein